MPGNPGGLARVDKLFGTHIYTSTFNASPLVFGAMPSLHSGFAVLIVLFAMHYSRRAGFLLSFYMCWQWWATMYLRHHYMVDLVVGGIYSCSVYLYARRHLSALPASRLGLPTSASSASLASLSLSSSTSSLSLSPSLSASSLLPTVMNSDFKLLQVVVVDEKQPLLPPEQLQMTQIQHSPRVGEDADQTSPITPPVGAGVGVGGGFKSRKASDREPGNANGGPVVDGLGAG
ncbi:Aureobasidin resistance protein Aur1, partial [Borealophlyctis nickersoniae]